MPPGAAALASAAPCSKPLERSVSTSSPAARANRWFSRLQDTLSDKLLPLLLRTAGELPGTAVENLNRAERLGIIRDTQEWLGARGVRNRLVHEYIDDLDALAASLDVARRFTTVLIEAAHAFRSYAEQRLGVPARRDPPIRHRQKWDAPASKQA